MKRSGMKTFASTSFSVSAAALSGHRLIFAPVRFAAVAGSVWPSKRRGVQSLSYSSWVFIV